MPEYSEYDVRRYSNPDTFLDAPMDAFECVSEPIPPGTKAPPRPPGKEREPADMPPADVPALVARIEAAMETIAVSLAEIKRLQAPPQLPPQSKAG